MTGADLTEFPIDSFDERQSLYVGASGIEPSFVIIFETPIWKQLPSKNRLLLYQRSELFSYRILSI